MDTQVTGSISDILRTQGTIVDKQTVVKYIDAMCDAFLPYKVPRFLVLQGLHLINRM